MATLSSDESELSDVDHDDAITNLDDGTGFVRSYGTVSTKESFAGADTNTARRQLRLRKEPGLPSTIRDAKVVDSRRRVVDHEESDDDSTVDGLVGYRLLGISDDSPNDDEGDEQGHVGDRTLKEEVPLDLLEEQRRIEEETRQQQLLIQQRHEEEQRKRQEQSLHTKNQHTILSGLFAARIQAQKVLDATNKLPLPQTFHAVERLIDSEVVTEARQHVASVLVTLHDLQEHLIQQHPEIGEQATSTSYPPPVSDVLESRRKRRRALIDTTPDLACEERIWDELDGPYTTLRPWLFQTADYWASKTSLKVAQSFKVLDQAPSIQLKKAMEVDFSRLLSKCTPMESLTTNDKAVETPEKDQPATTTASFNVFDDTEFYVTFLRDIMTHRDRDGQSVDQATLPEVIKRRKQKRDVERRASKGRAIRYVPIPELLGFMSAVPWETTDISQDSNHVDRLISSMFQG